MSSVYVVFSIFFSTTLNSIRDQSDIFYASRYILYIISFFFSLNLRVFFFSCNNNHNIIINDITTVAIIVYYNITVARDAE